ncbi:MAG: preprotein translocase subunit YajC [Parasporobacterium sp.]|nr:preprotein translocase subunit YajC [Parasporobacterium sp.]
MNFLNYLLFGAACFGQQNAETADGAQKSGSQWWVIVIYVVIFGAFIYFLMIRPQRKQKKQQEERMSSIEPGDSVLTTSGFYGTVVAINGDTVIVEFGNNKNCRIPMARQAISQIEKANGAAVAQTTTGQGERKFFGKKKAAEEAKEAVEEKVEEVKEAAEDAVETAVEAPAEAAAEAVEEAAEETGE